MTSPLVTVLDVLNGSGPPHTMHPVIVTTRARLSMPAASHAAFALGRSVGADPARGPTVVSFPEGSATAPDGTFSVTVRPGLYQVSGSSPAYHGGRKGCLGRTVRVTAGRQINVTVECQIK